ncbi:MAG: glycosyltransferase family 4 protein [Candidatus Hodarchaeota archaeon]
MEIEETTLTLFFTAGMGLKTWAEVGNLKRELELYFRLNKKMKGVNFVTYGGKTDKLYERDLGEINLLNSVWYSNPRRTILDLRLKKYLPIINRSNILKTNQIPGSEIPLWFKKKYDKKVIVRCGYLYSFFVKKRTENKKTINNAIQLEKEAFSSANIGIVTSSWQQEVVLKQYNIEPVEKIKIIPNYVVTDIFKPHPKIQKKIDLIFVGRAERQKNIDNLLKGLYYLKSKNKNVSLAMVGGCCSDNKIREMVKQYALNVIFKDDIPNFNLPHVLNQAKIFILPSHYEGHPKALLEAMSCGMPCIGTNVTGIKEDIKHLVTGYLCTTDSKSIAEAIEVLLADESLRSTLGKNAREYIIKNYSIDKVMQLELEAIKEVLTL